MRRVLAWLAFTAVGLALILGVSGQWGNPLLLAYVAAWSALAALAIVIVPVDTARARLRGGPAGADPISPPIFRLLFATHFLVGALDARFHWGGAVPLPLRAAGFVLLVGGIAVALWAVSVNRFFIPAVRIQHERGHRLVTSGPYAVVRHPGYAGLVWAVPGSGLALGSWLAAGLGVVMAAFVLRRVVVEDRFVMRELSGYAEYAARVPYRILPRVW